MKNVNKNKEYYFCLNFSDENEELILKKYFDVSIVEYYDDKREHLIEYNKKVKRIYVDTETRNCICFDFDGEQMGLLNGVFTKRLAKLIDEFKTKQTTLKEVDFSKIFV
jgi:hypothetical protein